MSQHKTHESDIVSILSILARAIENDSEAEQIAALRAARTRLRLRGMSIQQMLTGKGSTYETLVAFRELRERLKVLEGENDRLRALAAASEEGSRSSVVKGGVAAQVHKQSGAGWDALYDLASRRFLTKHGHLRRDWRHEIVARFGVLASTVESWELGGVPVPERIIEEVASLPESRRVFGPSDSDDPPRGERGYVLWSTSDLLRLYDLARNTAYTTQKIARLLTDEFGREISKASVTIQIRKRGMRDRGHFVDRKEI